MAWIYLTAAGLFEMTGVTMINKLHRDKNIKALLYLMGSFGMSFVLLSMAMETLAMGTAYAVWTGIGTAGGAVLGMLLYQEPKDTFRISCIAVVTAAAAGLKLIS
ncbi:DMT family transporter [Salibacterium qingdaonense]|uniref:Paired small multidrug resistance pump n=1 Tax=Salibacterium qingdaonense TaxID=266892 RepID=A0A1I4I786_9BACI|nr:multidrug efflux SMR transporter [Salibacterium qingdaonense]SFL49546.1 paired small multidrug resistance pump [Salibacterium qingdaonense]